VQLESVPCNICGAEQSDQLLVKGGLPISRCGHCGLVYANPRLPQAEVWQRYNPAYFWDEYMPAHHAATGEYLGQVHRQRSQPLLQLLEPYRRLNKLLEVGCAAGFFLKVATEENWKVTGVEIMEPAVCYARDTLGLDVRAGTLADSDLPTGGYDAVVMIETVEHLLDPAGTLRRAHELLRPEGVLLVTVPNYASIMRFVLGESWSVLSPAEHLYYFTERTLDQLLRRVGFRRPTFIWRLPEQAHEIMNPHNSHAPHSLRSRVVKWGILALGRWLAPIAVKAKRTDRLVVLATR
jgi:2-polyprenyl-3-methyl-5-hydroxy-6-metoxy-1,4-benzoquinol methylase